MKSITLKRVDKKTELLHNSIQSYPLHSAESVYIEVFVYILVVSRSQPIFDFPRCTGVTHKLTVGRSAIKAPESGIIVQYLLKV